MYLKIDLEDGISPVVQRWLKNNPRFISSVLKSTGYMVQNELKEAVRGKFTGQSWPQRWTLQDRRKLSRTAPGVWYGRLKNALGYAYDPADSSVNVGWTSRTAAFEGNVQEEGVTKQVTPGLRRLFHKRGIHLRATTTKLVTPERPFIEPKYMDIRDKIPAYITQKVQEYMDNGGFVKNVGKGRKYTVYSGLNAAAD